MFRGLVIPGLKALLVLSGAVAVWGASAQTFSPEERLQALRDALVQHAMEGPTEVRSSSWIDGNGVLRDSSSFRTGMVVRGVQVLSYGHELQQAKAQWKGESQPIPAGDAAAVCAPNGHERAQPWHHVVLEVAVSAQATVEQRQQSHQIAQALRGMLQQRNPQARYWRVSDRQHHNTGYEHALMSRGEQFIPWRLQLNIVPHRESWPADTVLDLRWTLLHRQERQASFEQTQTISLGRWPIETAPRRLPPVVMEQLQWVLTGLAQGLDQQLSCQPPQFDVINVLPDRLRIAGGLSNGLRVGDQLVVADRQQLPQRVLEPKALERLALAEVLSISGYYAELKQIAGPRLAGAAQWVAVPFTP